MSTQISAKIGAKMSGNASIVARRQQVTITGRQG